MRQNVARIRSGFRHVGCAFLAQSYPMAATCSVAAGDARFSADAGTTPRHCRPMPQAPRAIDGEKWVLVGTPTPLWQAPRLTAAPGGEIRLDDLAAVGED